MKPINAESLSLKSSDRVAYFGPWVGEFGWELMTWQAYCRKLSRQYDKSYVCSFPDMKPLYSDFAEFIPHKYPKRCLDWRDISDVEHEIPDDVTDHIKPIKQYRTDGEFIKFGKQVEPKYDVLIHARNIQKGSHRNYPPELWQQIAREFDSIACVGTVADHFILGTDDLRDIPLDRLMDRIASSRVVVGQSSGVMHLASLCGTPHVVWNDSKTSFGETVDKRYIQTWNPLKTPVGFIFDDDWRPEPQLVLQAIKQYLKTGFADNVNNLMGAALERAMSSGRWFARISYVSGEKVIHTWQTEDFPRDKMMESLNAVAADITSQDQIEAGHSTDEVRWR